MLKIKNFMQKQAIFSTLSLLLMLCCLLSGCSTTSSDYISKYKGYAKIPNLPKDYPTKNLPNGNVWKDFNSNTQLSLYLNQPSVKSQLNWYIKNQDFLNRSLTRGAQYFYYIFQETKRRNLPAELALIPVFESGYVPVGKSSQGAVGLWQFMPGTARHFKIKMNRWYDGRRDVIDSTETALRYLTYLYYFFDKDWYLAIAAYNCGEGNVQRAILRNKRQGKKIDFWSLQLPRETKSYVPQLLAISAIIKNPDKYGVSLVPINNGPYFDRIKLGKQISLDKASKTSGASEWSMRMLNAGLLRGETDPSGPHIIAIPRTNIEKFRNAIFGSSKVLATTSEPSPSSSSSSTIDNVSESNKSTTQTNKTVVNNKVSNNELSKIDLLNQEEQKNSAANLAKQAIAEHSNVSSQIADHDSSLKFDKTEDIESNDDVNDSDNSHRKVNNKHVTKNKTVVKHQKGKSLSTVNNRNTLKDKKTNNIRTTTRTYIVGRYDTLSSIAKQYGTTAENIKRINNLHTTVIKPNTVLHIPDSRK